MPLSTTEHPNDLWCADYKGEIRRFRHLCHVWARNGSNLVLGDIGEFCNGIDEASYEPGTGDAVDSGSDRRAVRTTRMTHFRLDTAFDVAARTAKVSTPLRSQAQSSEQTRLSKALQMEFCGLALLRSIVLVPAPKDPHKLRRQCRANALSPAAPAIRPAEVSLICHAPPIPSPTSCAASARPLPNNNPAPSFRGPPRTSA
jgi:hypothetical protein